MPTNLPDRTPASRSATQLREEALDLLYTGRDSEAIPLFMEAIRLDREEVGRRAQEQMRALQDPCFDTTICRQIGGRTEQ